VICLAVFDILCYLARYYYKVFPTYFLLLRIFTFVEYTLFALYLYYILQKYFLKKLFLISIFPFFIFCIYNYIKTKPAFGNIPYVIEFLFLITAIAYYFFEKLQLESDVPIFHTRSFWIIISFLFYSAGTFFLYLLSRSAPNDKEFAQQSRVLYAAVTIIKNILFSVSIAIKTVPEDVNTNKNVSFNDSIFEDE
jgi:hypothetical protein